MSTKDLSFPKLRALFAEHLKERRGQWLLFMWLFLILQVVVVVAALPIELSYLPPLAMPLMAAAFCALRVDDTRQILDRLEKIWSGADDNTDQLHSKTEEELGRGSVHFTNVVFTESHMIVFDSIDQGAVAKVSNIRLVTLHDMIKELNPYELYRERRHYVLGCLVAPLGDIILSTDETQMPDILYEMRVRHPDVLLNQEAHGYFFPSSVPVE